MTRKMKDSGVEWIGEIPEEWDVRKIKHICKVKGVVGHPDQEVLSLYRELGIVIKSKRDDNFNRTSENTDNYKFVEINDLVVNKMKAWQGSIAVSKFQGIVSPAYYVCTFYDDDVFPFYIHYLLRSVIYHPEYRRLSGGIRPNQWDLSIDNFRHIPIILPPPSIQHAISLYLDTKCSQIDSTIEKEREIIEKLKEYRQAVITEAVTKGIRPGVHMKDSGIEWIGEIPADWEIRKLKTLGIARNGLTYSPNDLSDDGLLVLRSSNIQKQRLSYEDNIYVKMDVISDLIVKENDLLICSRNGSRNLIGKCALIDKVSEGNTFGAFMCIYRSEFNKFIHYVMESSIFSYYLSSFLTSTISQLTLTNLNTIKIPFPPNTQTQLKIVSYLDAKCSAIDATIQKRELAIEKLTAYKQSLIYECVTGKREVLG